MTDVFEKLFRDTRAKLRVMGYDPKVMASRAVQASEFDAETDRLWEEAEGEFNVQSEAPRQRIDPNGGYDVDPPSRQQWRIE